MANPDSEGFIRSFARGLAVIEAMGQSGTHNVASIAAHTELPRTVVRRVLLTLCELGYAATDDKVFRLTPKILNLGMTYLTSLPFWGHAQRALEELCVAVGESCALAVFDGQEVVYALRIPSRKIMSLRLGVGSRVPAYATAPGRVLLAYQDREMLEAYAQATVFKAYTPATLHDKDELFAALEAVAREGYAWVDGEFDAAICGLGVPVRDDDGNVVAAISVNLLSSETAKEKAVREILPALREAAGQLAGMAPAFLGAARRQQGSPSGARSLV